jgi:tetratricopeptide (TPR) repeat protein
MTGNLDEAESALETSRRNLEVLPDHASEVVCYGHLATLHLRRGNLERAIEAADRAYALAIASPFPLFELFRGYQGPLEVYLEVWRRARGKDAAEAKRMRKTVFELCGLLHKTAAKFPVLQTYADRFEGIAYCLDGNRRRGHRLLQRAIAVARKRSQPLEEAMAELDLLRNVELEPSERTMHRDRARTLFRNTGSGMYLQMVGDEA